MSDFGGRSDDDDDRSFEITPKERKKPRPNKAPEHKSSVDICKEFNLKNTDIKFTEDDYRSITNYKLFSQHVRPLISKDNPKIAQAKLVVLLGAKWREFVANNPFKGCTERTEPVTPIFISSSSAAASPSTPLKTPGMFLLFSLLCEMILPIIL